MRKFARRAAEGKGAGFDAAEPQMERILFPKRGVEEEQLEHCDGTASIFARVRKGMLKETNQDCVAAFASGNLYMLGVFDGFDRGGAVFARAMAKSCISLAKEADPLNPDSELLLLQAVSLTCSRKRLSFLGTTATVALVLPDGRYDISSVGDSAAFTIGPRVERLLDYDWFYDVKRYETRKGIYRVKDLCYRMDEYNKARAKHFAAISRHGLVWDERICREPLGRAGGRLEKGSALLLCSDGITKNLSCSVDSRHNIVDISGIDDIARQVRGFEAREAGRKLFDAVTKRLDALGSGFKEEFRGIRKALILADDDISVASISF